MKFIFRSLLALSFSAALAVGTQTAVADGSACSTFGAFDTKTRFTLSAVTIGGDVISLVVNNVASVPRVGWLILTGNIDPSPWSILNLQDGVLEPMNPNLPQQRSVSLAVSSGTSPSFVLTQDPPPGAAAYCGVLNSDSASPALLALNGYTNLFSLCGNHTQTGVRQDLVYDGGNTKSLTNCLAVQVQIINS